ncbi:MULTISPECIES: hypothetical protein [Staphylococcus]|uniref:PhiSLT protein n=1 Tax=Staphylococcus agnetis TaxID=985762 RepID=A0AAW9YZA2_9STAP|nr:MULTISPECIES: hypothetical protein [Staphylococcus]NHM92477.1 hypothetical protein [Staphylococcus sp. 10602379]NJI03273.1 hypothetical protein [Staphylococcus agnetis]
MSVKVEGTNNMLRQIREEYGEAKMIESQDKALRKGSKYVKNVMQQNFQVFRDTGASIAEMTLTEPYTLYGRVRTVKLHWEGEMSRQSIIHLNEYGTVRNANPRGKGAIMRTMVTVEKPYREIIKESLRGDL